MSGQKTTHPPYLWPVGPAGLIAPDRVLAAGRWDSAPIRRAVRAAKAEGRLIDLTYGRASKWVMFLDSGHLVITAVPMPVAVLEDDEFDQLLIQKYGEL
jgi:extracellular matrix regulatory protein A